MTLPNWITVARMLLVPVFLVLASARGSAAAAGAFGVFLVASLSDTLDGYLARRNGVESRAGQFLDPLADKLLVGAALVVLVASRDFPLWAAVVLGGRELVVQVLRTQIVGAGRTLPASPAAKVKTVLQLVMVCWWLLPWDVNAGHWVALAGALVWSLWSGYEYLRAARTGGRVREEVA